MKDSCFAILHEGVITKIDGTVPGTLWLEVSCDYLRQKIKKSGNSFRLHLEGCTSFSYVTARGRELLDLREILLERPVFLSTDMRGEQVLVFCEAGILNLEFSNVTVFLNDNATITVDQLEAVASEHWDDMDKTSKSLSL